MCHWRVIVSSKAGHVIMDDGEVTFKWSAVESHCGVVFFLRLTEELIDLRDVQDAFCEGLSFQIRWHIYLYALLTMLIKMWHYVQLNEVIQQVNNGLCLNGCVVIQFVCQSYCKNRQRTLSNFAPNKYNHIYFESIKYHTIKATFQGKSTIF
jgi:dipeptide/tripeptide permease